MIKHFLQERPTNLSLDEQLILTNSLCPFPHLGIFPEHSSHLSICVFLRSTVFRVSCSAPVCWFVWAMSPPTPSFWRTSGKTQMTNFHNWGQSHWDAPAWPVKDRRVRKMVWLYKSINQSLIKQIDIERPLLCQQLSSNAYKPTYANNFSISLYM